MEFEGEDLENLEKARKKVGTKHYTETIRVILKEKAGVSS